MPQWDEAHPAAANWGVSSTAVMANSQYPEEAMRFAVWLNTNLDSVNLLIKGGYGWQALDNAYHRTILAARSPRRRRPPPLSAVPGPVRR